MTEKLKQKIKEEMNALPKELQDAINAIDWGKITEEIGKRYLLSESEMNDFQVETMLVLIGYVDLNKYTLNIENDIGLNKQITEKIVTEVIEKILDPMSDILDNNIKKTMFNRKTDWKQNVNFVLSGGDYSHFIAPMRENSPEYNPSNLPLSGEATSPFPSGRARDGLGIGGQILHPDASVTPQEGNKLKNLEDIKSKFTI